MRKILIISSVLLLLAVVTKGQLKLFSNYRECNGIVFVSGQIGTGAGKDVRFEAEVEAALKQVNGVLSEAGTSMSKVLSVTVYLRDIGLFGAFNELYGRYFKAPYPARTCVVVKDLVKSARVEISVIAAK